MEVTVKKVEITLPEVDMALLKELAKKFGWNIGRKKSGIEKGLEDIKAGRVYKAKDMEDLKKYLLNPMYRLEYTTNFKKDLKTCKKRGLELHLLQRVIDILQETGTLPNQYRPHKLSGKFEGLWECHIKSDWLLIWQQNDTELVLIMTDTGTHADLY